MTQRNVTDASGRKWQCESAIIPVVEGVAGRPVGQDVMLSCTTASVDKAVAVSVGWQWEKMSDNGLGRMITLASPLPKH